MKARAPRRTASTIAELTVVTNHAQVVLPPDVFTLEGFRTWALSDAAPEKTRVTYLQGKVRLDMSNEEMETHAAVKGEVARVLLNLNRELRLGKFYPDGVLVTNEEAGVSNNPDGTFVLAESLENKRVLLTPRQEADDQYIEVRGTPDLVVEVVSASSVKKDTIDLRAAYHRAGIPEYWLIDARGEAISFPLLRRGRTGYRTAPSEDGWQRSRVLGRSVRLDRQRDELGLWEYTLHVREA